MKKAISSSFIFLFSLAALLGARYCLADTGAVAAYNFNELKTGATIFSDQSGNDLNGKIHGAKVVGGINGAALYFNGAGDIATVANNDKLNFGTGDFTLSVWVKTITTSIGEAEGRRDILVKGDPYNSGYSLSSMNNRASSLVGDSGRSGYGGYCGTVPADPLDYDNFVCPYDKFINDGAWHNIVAERQNGVIKIYLDKQLVHQYQNGDDVSTSDDLIIGRHGEKDESFFRGKIDEIKIYSQAISENQITADYKTIEDSYSSTTEAQLDNSFGFDYAKEFDPANDGNYWYTVQPGDTPWNISEKLCSHGEWWKSMINPLDLHDPNHNTILWAGTPIKLSINQCGFGRYSPTPMDSSSAEGQSQTYEINKGDTLWSIAEKLCGSGYLWNRMFNPNNFTEVNGNIIIRYGETLTINPNLCQ